MRRVLVVAVMVWASTVVITPPGTAQAQTATKDCPAGSVCVWPDKDFGGVRNEIKDFKNGACIDAKPDFKSIKNKTNKTVQVYGADDCDSLSKKEGFGTLSPGSEKADLAGGGIEVT